MSRYLAAANAKRLALARSLSSLGSTHAVGDEDQGRKDLDVDALIAASIAEVGADMLPPTDAVSLVDELGGLDIVNGEGDAEEVDDEENDDEQDAVSKELERRRRLLLERRRGSDKISHNKANQGGGVTATMKSLNELALKRARAMVVKRFQTPLDLDDSSSAAYQIHKQATAAAAQLNGAVQTKLDALKRAADLMDESALKLTKLSDIIREIDLRIQVTNTVISNYEYLRRVHNVRDNLGRVLANIDFFTKVPDLVDGLSRALDSDPTQLKEIFLESIKLESLHTALVKEIKSNKGRRASVAFVEGSGRGRGASIYSIGDEAQRRMIDAVEEHLGVVPALSRKIRDQLWDAIGSYDHMMDIASRSPQTLVATFEIVEMHQEYMDRRVDQAQRSGELEGMNPDFIAATIGYESISDECQARIRSLFENHVEGTFQMVVNDAQTMKAQSKTASITSAATELVKAVAYFKHELDPCFPPKYNALETFLDVLEEHLVPESQAIMRGLDELTTKETLRLIDWFHFYQLQVAELETGLRPSTEKFEKISEDLMDDYINKVKVEIFKNFENIRKQFWQNVESDNPDVQPHPDGTIVTTGPQDIYKALDMSLQIGAAKLPAEMLHKPIYIALQCLQEYMRETYNLLEMDLLAEEKDGDQSPEADEIRNKAENMRRMKPELMVALVNDCHHSADDFRELGDKFIVYVTQPDLKENLMDQLDAVTNFFTDLALHALNFLSRSVLQSELQQCFLAIFSPEWERGEPVAGVIVDTLDQVLEMCRDKLELFYYRKLTFILLSSSVELYLAAILRAGGDSHDTYRFTDDLATAYQVDADLNMIKEMFSKYEDDLTYGGLRAKPGSAKTPLDDSLEPIAALQAVLQAGQFLAAEEAIKILLEKYPDDGVAIVRCAIVFRPDGSLRPAEKKSFERAVLEYHDRLQAVKNADLGVAPQSHATMALELDARMRKKNGGILTYFFGGK